MMLMIVTVVFAACNTLPFILNFIESAKPDFFIDNDTKTLAYHLNDMSNLLVVLNSATTSLIYFAFSQKYRDILLCTMTCAASRWVARLCGCSEFAAGKYLTLSTNLSRTNTSLRASRLSNRSRCSAAVQSSSVHFQREDRSGSFQSRTPLHASLDHIARTAGKSSDVHGSPNLLSVQMSLPMYNGQVNSRETAPDSDDENDDHSSPLLGDGLTPTPTTEETSFVSSNLNQ